MSVTATTMSSRIAAQAVIEELVGDATHLAPRSRVERILGRSPLSSSGVPWYLGAQGEIAVGRMLEQLPEGWTVFHALPVGTKEADIDHLVVGPGGVFTINTKHHRGKAIWVANRTLMVSGHRQPHIRNAEHEAARVTRLVHQRLRLDGRVRPIVAIHGAASLVVKERPDLVAVLDARHLRRWLLERPVQLDPEDVARIVALVDDPTTWRTELSEPGRHLMARFTELDQEVRAADTRRTLWTLGGLGAIGAGAVIAAPALLSAVLASVMGAPLP